MNTNIKMMVALTKMHKVFLEVLGSHLESLGINPSEYTMLAHLNEVTREKTQKLGEVALITSGTITHVVNKMIRSGYVEKVQDNCDKRIFWIQITDDGKESFMKVHEKHMAYLDRLLKDFSEEEKETFIEQVAYFGKSIEKKCQK